MLGKTSNPAPATNNALAAYAARVLFVYTDKQKPPRSGRSLLFKEGYMKRWCSLFYGALFALLSIYTRGKSEMAIRSENIFEKHRLKQKPSLSGRPLLFKEGYMKRWCSLFLSGFVLPFCLYIRGKNGKWQ